MGSGGSFVAILLSIPLTAVALVGVVGVPKLQEILSSATSSHSSGDDEFDPDSFSPRSRSKRGSRADREKEDDAALWGDETSLKDEFSDDLGTKKPSRGKSSSLARNGKPKPADDSFGSDLKEESDDFFSKPRSRAGAPKETETGEMYATEPYKPRSGVLQAEHVAPANTPRATGRPDNFAAAIEKLRGMGIDRFHLEPGLGAGQFLFVCQVESAGESATVHRFEAEHSDPTAAVADVMKQLSQWQAESSVTRTAEAGFRR